MNKREIKRFLDTYPFKEFSVASFEYGLFLSPEIKEIASVYIEKYHSPSDEENEEKSKILQAEKPEDYVRLMRKPLHLGNQQLLRSKILEHEQAVLPLIQQKALTNLQDFFIENTTHFFLHSEHNYCDWIIENYDNFKSEYLKSMLCLVLGFRGEEALIPMLMAEAERFSTDYPFEDYEQGPILAVQELAIRFLNY